MFDVSASTPRSDRDREHVPVRAAPRVLAGDVRRVPTGRSSCSPTGGGKVMGTAGNLRLDRALEADGARRHAGLRLPPRCARAREQGADFSVGARVVLGAEKVPPGLKHEDGRGAREAAARSDVAILGTYGFTEARMAFAECPAPLDDRPGYHVYPDLGVFEVVDPKTRRAGAPKARRRARLHADRRARHASSAATARATSRSAA